MRPTREELEVQLDRIEALICRHPEGIGLPALVDRYAEESKDALTGRTMGRRIADLKSRRRIRVEGTARATRYYPQPGSVAPTPIEPVNRVEPSPPVSPQEDDHVFLSLEGKEVRALIRRPFAARKPVGYDEGFLRGYQPGETWYLPEEMRRRLHEFGRTPDSDRPAGTFARDVFERLLIDLAWASSRLEGNTYSRLDTKNLLEHGVRAEGKDAREAQMILNHKKAIELLVEGAEAVGFNRHTFFNLHAALAENLLDDPKDEGRIRNRLVNITGTTYMPIGIPQKLDELFDVLLAKVAAIPDAFEQAFFVMVHIPYLQPFADVNKRTSRVAANLPLIKANLCPLSFVGVPDRAYLEGTLAVYENTRVALLRDVFAWAYERSCAQYRVMRDAMGDPDPMRLRYREQLAEAVRSVVLDERVPRLGDMLRWAESHDVPAADQETFAETALNLVVDLHDGAIARYGLRPSEFQRWKTKVSAPE